MENLLFIQRQHEFLMENPAGSIMADIVRDNLHKTFENLHKIIVIYRHRIKRNVFKIVYSSSSGDDTIWESVLTYKNVTKYATHRHLKNALSQKYKFESHYSVLTFDSKQKITVRGLDEIAVRVYYYQC